MSKPQGSKAANGGVVHEYYPHLLPSNPGAFTLKKVLSNVILSS